MEANKGPRSKGERKAPQLTPDGPFSGGNQYKYVDITELTEMRRTTHLRRMRARLGPRTEATMPIETLKPEHEDLLPGDFEIYQLILVDALHIDPEQARIQSSALRGRYEHGTRDIKELISTVVVDSFRVLYPEGNNGNK